MGLLSAANVCKGWNDTARRVWRAAEELRLRVPAKAQVGFVASILQKCTNLMRLSLRMERCGACLNRRLFKSAVLRCRFDFVELNKLS